MRKWLFINACLIFLIIHILLLASASAYRTKVHEIISKQATENSQKYRPAMEDLGLWNQGEIKSKSLLWWVQRGSSWEDSMLLVWGTGQDILYCHFHNPITGFGYTDSDGEVKGQSLIARANDATNEWSYGMAKKLYYAALTGDNNEIVDSFTAMRAGFLGDVLSRQTNMSKEDRDQYFAWTLQALGHTLHLVQDASVPAHTRNDFHGLFEPFEKWTNKNRENLPYGDEGSSPWVYWSQHADTLIPDVFIDTNQLDNNDTAPVSGSDQGIAEYSHANFMSEDSIFTFDLPLKPDWSDFYYYQNDDINLDVRQDMTFVYLRNKHPGGVDHLALAGVLHPYPISSDLIHDVRWTTNDTKVNEDYALKLIPRAVGYSAGLLDYFFRGAIEITLPDNGIYALTDLDPDLIEPSQQGFDRITLLAKNISADNEEMTGGTVTLVVKYKVGEGDQFQNPPAATSDEFHYIVKELGGTRSIPRDTPALFEFDINDSQIPLWATDVYIYLVYKGNLGSEEGAIAVGFKDISEPTSINYHNVMDKICMSTDMGPQLFDSGSTAAIAHVDADENGVADPDEWDVYPHNAANIHIRFSPVDRPQAATSESSADNNYEKAILNPGEYFRLFILSDYRFNRSASVEVVKIADDDQCDLFHGTFSRPPRAMDGIKNQTELVDPVYCGYEPCYARIIPGFHTTRGVVTFFSVIFDNASYPIDSICSYED